MSQELQRVVEQSAVAVVPLDAILRAAQDPATDLAKMEGLISLYERMQDRQSRQAFNAAMVECQAKMPHVRKDESTNFGRYATLGTIDTWTRKIYEEHGFSVSYNTAGMEGSRLVVQATVRHRGGHSEVFSMPLELDSSGAKNKTQGVGSTTSYGRRYLLKMIFNIIEEGEDNDGAGAPQYITPKQVENLVARLDACNADKAIFCKFLGISTLDHLHTVRWQDADRELKRKEAKGKA